MRTARAAGLLALVLAVPCAMRADVLHLRSGAAIRTSAWWVEGDQLLYESPAGVVGIPRSELVRIEPAVEPVPPSIESAPSSALPPATAFEDEDRPDRSDSGLDALRARDFETASRRFLEAIREDPDDPNARIGYVASEMALGRDALALNVVLEGLVRTPDVAELHELLGDLLNREERVEDALAAWRDAFRLRAGDRVREKILKGERELAAGRNLTYTTTAHFTIRFDGDVDAAIADPVVAWLEEAYGSLARRFRHYPGQPITVLLYAERDFRDVTRAPEWVGGLYDGKIRVPLGGLRRLDDRARAVLVHELTHAFVHDLTRGNCPRWLHEGIAQLVEGRAVTPAQAREIRERLETVAPTRWDADGLSYPGSLSLVGHLVDLRGEAALVRLLETLGDGTSLDDALELEYGLGYADVCASWARAVRAGRGRR